MNILNFIKSNKKEIVIAFSFLIVGIIISPTPVEIVEKPVIKEVKKIEYSETCEKIQIENGKLKRQNNIQRQVMDLDDEIIYLGSQGMGYCSQMLVAASEFDYNKLNYLTDKVELLTPQMSEAGNKKLKLLEQLENIK